ncbi:hypothetical protein [Nonomuraea maritima]|uniref:hypothetical protein n=1 Tax=Nonomuraea maritima TaxID=683260 RepID=UPI00371C0385
MSKVIEPLRPGDPREVGPYALRGRLGADGLGRLFLGRAHDGRLAAVRVIFPGLADDEGFRRGFAAEVEAARRVCGPFTVPVVDADASADQPWLATAYVPGPCLRRAVETHGSGLPTDLALLITACLAKNPHHRPTVTDVLDRLTAPPQKPGQEPGQEPGRLAARETIQGAGRRAALEAGQEAPRWPPTSVTTVIAHPRRAAAQPPPDPTDGPRGSAPVVDVAEVAAVGLAITTPAMRAAKRVTDVGVGALQIAALFGAVGLMTLIISGDPGWAWEFTRHLASGFWWFWILGLAAAFVHSGSDGHDRLTVDADRIVVADERWVRWRDRSLSIPWTRIERVRLVAEPGGTAHSVVVTFRDGHEPGERWETRHNVRTRHGGHVVARLSVAPGDLARAALPSRLRDALRRHGKDKYTPDPPPGA